MVFIILEVVIILALPIAFKLLAKKNKVINSLGPYHLMLRCGYFIGEYMGSHGTRGFQ